MTSFQIESRGNETRADSSPKALFPDRYPVYEIQSTLNHKQRVDALQKCLKNKSKQNPQTWNE